MSLFSKLKKIRKKKKDAKKSKLASKASSNSSNSQSSEKINPITGMTTEAEMETLSKALAKVTTLSKDDAASFLKQAQDIRDRIDSGQPISKANFAAFRDATSDTFKKLEKTKGLEQLNNPFTMTQSELNQQVDTLAQTIEEAVKVPSDNTQKMLKDSYALMQHLTQGKQDKGDSSSANSGKKKDSDQKNDSAPNVPDIDYQTLLNNFKESYSKNFDALAASEAGKPIGSHLFKMTKDELDAEIKDVNQKIADAKELPPDKIHEFVRDAYALREKLFDFSWFG